MNLFSIILFIKGFSLKNGYDQLKRIQSVKDVDFFDWQEKTKWAIFKHHFCNNELFRNRLNNNYPAKWNDIPVMTKKDLQVNFDQLLTHGFSKNELYISNTSGSSGHPFFFAKNKECHSLTWGIIKE